MNGKEIPAAKPTAKPAQKGTNTAQPQQRKPLQEIKEQDSRVNAAAAQQNYRNVQEQPRTGSAAKQNSHAEVQNDAKVAKQDLVSGTMIHTLSLANARNANQAKFANDVKLEGGMAQLNEDQLKVSQALDKSAHVADELPVLKFARGENAVDNTLGNSRE